MKIEFDRQKFGNIKSFINHIKTVPDVTEVALWNKNIGDQEAKDLAEGLRGTNVTTIDFRINNIGAQGAKDLALALHGTNVTTIHLHANNIGDQGAKDLAEGLRGTNVTTIHLHGNNIGDQGAKDLALGLRGTNVTTINLGQNKVGNEGAKNLAEGLRGTNVTTIDLRANNIYAQGAKDLALGLRGTNVTTIDLHGNNIGDEGTHAIISMIQSNKIRINNELGVHNIDSQYNATTPEHLNEMYAAASHLIELMKISAPILGAYPVGQQTKAALFNRIFQKQQHHGQEISWSNISASDVLDLACDALDGGTIFTNIAIELAAYDTTDSNLTKILSELANKGGWQGISEILDRHPQYNKCKLLESTIFAMTQDRNTEEMLRCVDKILNSIEGFTDEVRSQMRVALESCTHSSNKELFEMCVATCTKHSEEQLTEYAQELLSDHLQMFDRGGESGSDTQIGNLVDPCILTTPTDADVKVGLSGNTLQDDVNIP